MRAVDETLPTSVRDCSSADMIEIQKIYSFYVLNGVSTFEEVPPTLDELSKRRNKIVSSGLPYLAASLEDEVVGYAYASPYRTRPAYRYAVEDSVYVRSDVHSKGIGKALLSALISRCEAGDWRQMIAIIGDSENAASIRLHRLLGFEQIGTLGAVGFKLGRWVDTVLMQRSLGQGDHALPKSIR